MNIEAPVPVEAKPPLWRRIVDFPLVSLVIAVALLMGAGALGGWFNAVIPLRGTLFSTLLKAGFSVLLTVAVYKLVIRHLGMRKRDDLRWTGRGVRDLGIGLVGGAGLFAAVVLVAGLMGIYRYTGPDSATEFLFALLITGLVPGVVEEILLRGVLFRFLEELGGTWVALALSSLVFGLAHGANPNATLVSSLAIALEAGVLLGGAYMATRKLWLAIGLHAGWNVTQGGIFGLPVSGFTTRGLFKGELGGDTLLSGGAFGLEASLIAVSIVTLAGVAYVVWAIRRGHIVGPYWRDRRAVASALPA